MPGSPAVRTRPTSRRSSGWSAEATRVLARHVRGLHTAFTPGSQRRSWVGWVLARSAEVGLTGGAVVMHARGNGVGELRRAMHGPVITPGDAGFDEARRVWNSDIDRRPSAIARCTSTADVIEASTFAQEHMLEMSVRAGAHSTAGLAVSDGGLMIDLSQLNAVTVDPGAKRATVGGGALLGDLDAATQQFGLAVPAGLVSHTGVGGLTLGGGMGWLTRKFGLTIDNLLSAEVVTASGEVLRAAPDENPDLFWAIRGGGGNFGIVTSFEFQLHEVDPMVQFGLFFWPLEQGPEALRLAG